MTETPSRSYSVSETDLTGAIRAQGPDVDLDLYIQPRASQDRLLGMHDGRLKVSLCAPPVDGQANRALVVFLSSRLGVSRGRIEIVSGQTGRRKRVRLQGLSVAETLRRLEA